MGTGDIIFSGIVAILVVWILLPRSRGERSQPGDNQSTVDFSAGNGDADGD